MNFNLGQSYAQGISSGATLGNLIQRGQAELEASNRASSARNRQIYESQIKLGEIIAKSQQRGVDNAMRERKQEEAERRNKVIENDALIDRGIQERNTKLNEDKFIYAMDQNNQSELNDLYNTRNLYESIGAPVPPRIDDRISEISGGEYEYFSMSDGEIPIGGDGNPSLLPEIAGKEDFDNNKLLPLGTTNSDPAIGDLSNSPQEQLLRIRNGIDRATIGFKSTNDPVFSQTINRLKAQEAEIITSLKRSQEGYKSAEKDFKETQESFDESKFGLDAELSKFIPEDDPRRNEFYNLVNGGASDPDIFNAFGVDPKAGGEDSTYAGLVGALNKYRKESSNLSRFSNIKPNQEASLEAGEEAPPLPPKEEVPPSAFDFNDSPNTPNIFNSANSSNPSLKKDGGLYSQYDFVEDNKDLIDRYSEAVGKSDFYNISPRRSVGGGANVKSVAQFKNSFRKEAIKILESSPEKIGLKVGDLNKQEIKKALSKNDSSRSNLQKGIASWIEDYADRLELAVKSNMNTSKENEDFLEEQKRNRLSAVFNVDTN